MMGKGACDIVRCSSRRTRTYAANLDGNDHKGFAGSGSESVRWEDFHCVKLLVPGRQVYRAALLKFLDKHQY